MALPSFLSSKAIEHEVLGKSQKFFPISVKTLFAFRNMAKPIAQSVAALFARTADDVAKESEEMTEGSSGGGYKKHLKTDAIAPEMAKFRHAQRQTAIEQLLEVLLAEDASFVLARMIMDSMREAGFSRSPTTQDLSMFCESTDGEAMMEMISGMVQANKKLFAPLTDGVTGLMDTLKQKAAQAAKDAVATTDEHSKESQTTGT